MLVRSSVLVLTLLLTPALPALGVSVYDQRLPGVEIEFSAVLEPAGSASGPLPGGVWLKAGRIHRTFSDSVNRVYFGYDVLIEASKDGRSFQIRVEPLTASAEVLTKIGLNPAWTRLTLPAAPVIPEIRLGATVKLDVLINPATGQKLVDAIAVKRRGASKSPPREFTVADAQLRFDRPQVQIDGSPLPTSGNPGVSGAGVWFYVPGRGRFVLSLSQQPGFRKTGEVSGVRLVVREESSLLEIESREPIAPGEGNFFVYVGRDPAWAPPAQGQRRFMMGAADRMEWIK